MKKLNIVMVEPKSPGHHVFSFVHLPRLGLPILGTLAAQAGHQVKIFIEEIQPIDQTSLAWADLLCISTITSTVPQAYQLADQARALGVKVIMGGAHVGFLIEEALQHADWVFKGEAERSFVHFLDCLARDGDFSLVPGLHYLQDGQGFQSTLEDLPISMSDDVPIPDFSLVQGQGASFHRGVIPIQTSRGCPHFCTFCSVTPMFGRKMRHMPPHRVAAELEQRRGQGDQVFFYDDNFCAPPARTKALLDHLLTHDVFMPKPLAQVSVKAAFDPELLKLMQRANFFSVFVGFESINKDSLQLYEKRQAVDDIRRCIRYFQKHGIRVHGMFVTGSDADTVNTIRDTAQFAIDEGLNSIQFLVLTPLPGTPLISELEQQGRLLTDDWSLYDTHHAVFQPARMTPYELMTETFNAMGRVYSKWRSIKWLARGRFHEGMISWWASGQVRRWKKENRALLKAAKRLAPLESPHPV